MKKKKKTYPFDGPSLKAQEMMQRPETNRQWLRDYFKNHKVMRPETRAVAFPKVR